MPSPIADRIARIQEKKDQLEARLRPLKAKAKSEERKRDTRRKIVVGGAILAAIEKDAFLALHVRKVLTASVRRPNDREAIADLLTTAPALA